MAKQNAASITTERLVSVDALRGFDMFWITGGGDIVRDLLGLLWKTMPVALGMQFEHAKWDGFYAWDLIMPLFLFIVGTSLPFAMSKRLESKDARRGAYRRILRRFVILFLLGIAIQGNLFKFDITKLHLFCNTLQAIAVGYVVASLAMMNLRVIWQGVLCAGLLVGYWLLMVFVPVPGVGAGKLFPDANLALYVDQVILGRFRDGTAYTWILSSMTFSTTVLLGVMSGHILKLKIRQGMKFLALAGAGVALVAAGLVADHWFPIIKHIWSPSFTLYVGGLSFLLLAFFYGVIDVIGLKKWSFFFVVIGSNAIFIYTFYALVNGPVGNFVVSMYDRFGMAVAAPLGLCFFALQWVILYIMYRKRFFIKV